MTEYRTDPLAFTQTGDISNTAWPELQCPVGGQLAIRNGDVRLDAGRRLLFETDGQLGAPGSFSFVTGTTPGVNLRIQADGKIAIGKPAAAHALDVQGIVNATDFYKNGAPLSGSKWDGVAGGINFTSGNVGVGTPTLAARLHVTSGGDFNAPQLQVTQSNAADWARLRINTGGNTPWDISVGSAANLLNFYIPDRNVLTLTPAGNVGIGTTTVDSPLHILGGRWDLTNSEGDLKIGDSTYRLKIGVARGGGGAGDVRIRAQGGTSRLMLGSGTTDALFVVNDRIGIGAVSPAHRLHVAGGNAVVNNVFLGDVGHGGGWAGFSHSNSASTVGYGLLQNSDGRYTLINKRSGGGHIGFRVDNNDRMTIDDNGDIWVSGRIGTRGHSPVPLHGGWGGGIHTFDVEAEATVWTRNLDVENAAFISRGANQVWFFKSPATGSDARLKTNVAQLSGTLEKLDRIRGVSFERTDILDAPDTSREVLGQQEIGVIAQEVEDVFPELVTTGGEQNYKAVSYNGLVGVLIEAVKELKGEVGSLKRELASMRAS